MNSILDMKFLYTEDINGKDATCVLGKRAFGDGLNTDDAVDAYIR